MIQKILSLRNHAGFTRYFRNSAWMFGEQILRMITGLLVGIWVARYLGPEQFGTFSYVIAFTSIFSNIAKLGLDSILVKELVNQPEKQDIYLGTAFWLKLLGALFVVVLIALALPWTNNDSTTNFYIFIIAAGLIFQSFEVVDFYFQSQVLAKFVSICKIIQLTLSSLLKIYLVLTEAELIWFVWIILFDQFTLAITLYIAYRYQKSKHLSLGYFKIAIAIKLLGNSWPLIFGSLAATIYIETDKIMIKEIIGYKSVGYYTVATTLSNSWLFITVLLTKSLHPSIISSKQSNYDLYIYKLQSMYDILIKLSVIISITIFLFSDVIVIKLFGSSYQESIAILNVYIWSIIFVFLSNGSWSFYINENLQKIASIRLILGAIINVSLNFYFIRNYGAIGAAYSTLLSMFISSYLINFFFKKTRVNFFLQTKSLVNFLNIDTWKNPIRLNKL